MAAPQYLGPATTQEPATLISYLKDQVTNPQYREGNLNILKATTIFVLGIAFVRSDLSAALVPVF
ncbi:hypothetical protein L202_04093 [Cryptococcus amylolentus CBS 6039]|uniref:Uncharacterized protein n=2 Tax=Cryptococcus amylolentus TaxID=104669 RepID=A0A1E3HQ46_9TREE|nr:hypothetical protein L202_04093 [Cryptococcus amylolentus CBS 6039]ODN78457.1 hypothetical protein L202_04093 [Cryptococcus amylolentus CBS 6039]ODO06959.1 hypothetical protein I350_04321 [Cryptococcus amylolentus CBS 6273]